MEDNDEDQTLTSGDEESEETERGRGCVGQEARGSRRLWDKRREDPDVRDEENTQKRARRAEGGEYRDALHVRDVNRKWMARTKTGTAASIDLSKGFFVNENDECHQDFRNHSIARRKSISLAYFRSRVALAGAKRRLVRNGTASRVKLVS